MFGFALLISVPMLVGLALAWRRRVRAPRPGSTMLVSARGSDAHDPHPESADGENGLADFYAYLMAVSRINRT